MKIKITATRRLQYAIGHRVPKHESKCRHLHGHNFVFLLSCEAEKLDEAGRIRDFGVLKSELGGWIEAHWDHGFVLEETDVPGVAAMVAFSNEAQLGQKLFLLPYAPTAENLARYLLEEVGPKVLAGTGVCLNKVVVYETENGIAEATL